MSEPLIGAPCGCRFTGLLYVSVVYIQKVHACMRVCLCVNVCGVAGPCIQNAIIVELTLNNTMQGRERGRCRLWYGASGNIHSFITQCYASYATV
jgi:hypothetical protein